MLRGMRARKANPQGSRLCKGVAIVQFLVPDVGLSLFPQESSRVRKLAPIEHILVLAICFPVILRPSHTHKMDLSLRCNILKCRVLLSDQAVVTTCRYRENIICYIDLFSQHAQSHLLHDLRQQFRPGKSSERHPYLSSM